MMRSAVMALGLLAAIGPRGAFADELSVVPYFWLDKQATNTTVFDHLLSEEEHLVVDGVLTSEGVVFAERFEGQLVSRGDPNTGMADFDVVSGAPTAPLTLLAGEQGRNLSIYYERGRTARLYGESWVGYPQVSSAGEGVLSMQFDEPQRGFGFMVSASWEFDTYKLGQLLIECFDHSGNAVGDIAIQLRLRGQLDGFGLMTPNGEPTISGCTIASNDPKGVSFERFIFGFEAALAS